MIAPDHVSHVLFCMQPEDFDPAVDFWRSALSVAFEEMPVPEMGLRVMFSLAHGIEIVTPINESAPSEFLEFTRTHGSGLYAAVYAVPDIERAVRDAEASGATVSARLSYTDRSPWKERYRRMEEAVLEPVLGMRVVLAEIELL